MPRPALPKRAFSSPRFDPTSSGDSMVGSHDRLRGDRSSPGIHGRGPKNGLRADNTPFRSDEFDASRAEMESPRRARPGQSGARNPFDRAAPESTARPSHVSTGDLPRIAR